MATMQALVLETVAAGPRVATVGVDALQAGEVLVRVKASGICGSDLHVLHGRSNISTLPLVLGHEGAGVVEAVGERVNAVAPGDHVVIGMYAPCGACAPCSRRELHLCADESRMNRIRGIMDDGHSRLHLHDAEIFPYVGLGTLAEHVIVPSRQLVKIADSVPFEVAALSACGVITGLGAVFNIARPEPGATVLVVGCGGVGLSAVQGCRIAGATRIIAVDANPARLALAMDLGATDVIDASKGEMVDAVRALVPGGVDYAFEVVGQVELVAQALELVRPGGTCVATATYPPGSTIPIAPQGLLWDRRLVGCLAGNSVPRRDIPRIMDLYERGVLYLDELAAHRWPLADVSGAIAAAEAGTVARAVVTFA